MRAVFGCYRKKMVDEARVFIHILTLQIKTPDNWRLLGVALVAQLVEHVLGKDGVGGSSPLWGSHVKVINKT